MADWCDIPGFDGRYQIGRYGDVRYSGPVRHRVGKLVKPITRYNRGVPCVTVTLTAPDGRRVERSVAALMVRAWIGEISKRDIIVHIDGDRLNNGLKNLRVTQPAPVRPRQDPKTVVMIDRGGTVRATYRSARQAAAANFVSADYVLSRCHREVLPESECSLITGMTFRFGGDTDGKV